MGDPKNRKHRGKRGHRPPGSGRGGVSGGLTLRRLPGEDAFELVYPPCVHRREADMEEARAMLDAGEIDVAVDELRWLLEGCKGLLEAHRLLGEVALADGDLPLARAHFGYGYELGVKALPAAGLQGTLPYSRPANRPFLEAGKGRAAHPAGPGLCAQPAQPRAAVAPGGGE